MDQQSKSGDLSQDLEREIRQLYFVMKQAFLYPEGHPIRATAAGEMHKLLCNLLSRQESHSLTAIEDRIYFDMPVTELPRMDVTQQYHVASDMIAAAIAREFRRWGIRTVTFCRGIEIQEMSLFLNIMATSRSEVRKHGGASRLLRASGHAPNIELLDLEYEDASFEFLDDREDWIEQRAILTLYLRGMAAEITDQTYEYLSSLLQEPGQMARLIEECMGYDDVHEPDSEDAIQCFSRLIDLEEYYIDEERRDFHRKLLEVTLLMEYSVKNALFDASCENNILIPLMNDLSVSEIVSFAILECITDAHAALLRKIFDGLLASDSKYTYGSIPESLVEAEALIQSEMAEMGQEDTFRNILSPLFEEIFTELQTNELQNEQARLRQELERLLRQKQEAIRDMGEIPPTPEETDGATALPTVEDELVAFASILMEMVESETDYDGYSDVIYQLAEMARAMIMEAQTDVTAQNLDMTLLILDTLFRQENTRSDRSPEWQDCPRKAIDGVATREFIRKVLHSALRTEPVGWSTVERLIHQIGERAMIPLVETVLSTGSSSQHRKLKQILMSAGPMAVPELQKQLSQEQQINVLRQIILILGEIGGTEASDCLSQALKHSDPQVRQDAVSALAGLETHVAMELILGRIWDNEEQKSVKQWAISALVKMHREEAAAEIEKIVRQGDAALQKEAINALGAIGEARSISVLSDIFARRLPILGRRRAREIQIHAVRALGRIGTQPVIKVLLEVSRRKRGKVKLACDEVLQSLDQIEGQ